ncbi:hypothetical protein, partial [Neobacillus terrae]|uniref:hypothetical protein n=1 Tax=Neobacillus terrae TaxID=3034837 RepID=UPI003B75B782
YFFCSTYSALLQTYFDSNTILSSPQISFLNIQDGNNDDVDNEDDVDNGGNNDDVDNGDTVDSTDDDNQYLADNQYIADNKLVEFVYPFLFPSFLKPFKPRYVFINKRVIGQISILK